MSKLLARWSLVALLGGVSLAAQAQNAYTVKDVNLRAGPAREYPVVYILPAGTGLDVVGCLSDYSWCDVVVGPYRGWVYAGNIDYAYQGQYVAVPVYGPVLGITIISFTLLDYWGRHYPHQPFYRDRDRWEHYAPPRPRHVPVQPAPAIRPEVTQPRPRVQPPPRVEPPPRVQPSPWVQPPPRVQPQPRMQPQPRVESPPRVQSPGRVQAPREVRPAAPQGRGPAQAPRPQTGPHDDRGRQGGDRGRGPVNQ